MREVRIIEYATGAGRYPFSEWLTSKKIDPKVRAIIDTRLNRLMLGLAGDCEHVGEGIFELRIHFRAGYRVYFAYYGSEIVILLCGGDKRSQPRDIGLAKNYWADFRRRNQS